MISDIPIVDLSSDKPDISNAFRELGFLSLRSPVTPSPEEIQAVFDLSERFFLCETLEEKNKVLAHERVISAEL